MGAEARDGHRRDGRRAAAAHVARAVDPRVRDGPAPHRPADRRPALRRLAQPRRPRRGALRGARRLPLVQPAARLLRRARLPAVPDRHAGHGPVRPLAAHHALPPERVARGQPRRGRGRVGRGAQAGARPHPTDVDALLLFGGARHTARQHARHDDGAHLDRGAPPERERRARLLHRGGGLPRRLVPRGVELLRGQARRADPRPPLPLPRLRPRRRRHRHGRRGAPALVAPPRRRRLAALDVAVQQPAAARRRLRIPRHLRVQPEPRRPVRRGQRRRVRARFRARAARRRLARQHDRRRRHVRPGGALHLRYHRRGVQRAGRRRLRLQRRSVGEQRRPQEKPREPPAGDRARRAGERHRLLRRHRAALLATAATLAARAW